MNTVLLVVAVGVLGVLLWMQLRKGSAPADAGELARIQGLLDAANERVRALESAVVSAQNAQRESDMALARAQERLAAADAARSETESQREQLKNEFKVVAQEALSRQSQMLQEQLKQGNKAELDVLLAPFRAKLEQFGERVEKTHHQGVQERSELKAEVRNLMEQSEKLRNEANALTKALRSDSKAQGNWGEMVLEKLLERSGLTRDLEYSVQASTTDADGRRLQPDVVLNLPEGKHLVIDSKVSMVAYERFVNAETPEEQAVAMKEHIASLRAHIRGLSEKNYQNLYDVSLDFVLLFVPIEGAFSTALQAQPELYQEAFDRNIALVSTTTLWTTLRTVGTLWRQERQNRNVGEIIRQASDLYDKFVGFSEEMIKVGNQMKTATNTYENAMKQLSQGKGNLVRRAEQLRQLGLKNSKSTNPSLVDRAMQGESEEDETENL
ncbi:MAG: DNA recombination protein RmuC [Schleiferiaceae bacterium]|jgi:DNA recombination protein RmuC